MRRLTLLATILAICTCTFAQKDKSNKIELPGFGKIDKADLELKECPFDEKAEAMVLIDEGELDYVFGKGFELKHRMRIKILTEKGLDRANIQLKYYSGKDGDILGGIDAQTFNIDANGAIQITKLDKKLIYDKKINKRISEKVFSLPDVKVGSVIEYKYKKGNIGLVDWSLQGSIPVRYSRFVTDMPQELDVRTVPYCSHPYTTNRETSGTRVINTYSVQNVTGFRDEPYILNEDFYLDRLETKLIAFDVNGRRENLTLNWVQVIRIMMEDEDFGLQLKKNIPRTADLDDELKKISAPYLRMKTIYNYVKQNMKWNEYPGIWALDGVKSAWKDKIGTSGEINLILVNLLRDADLKAHAVLVSSRDNGVVNTFDPGTIFSPGYRQFDKVMAFVEIGKDVYVLDASQKDIPVHLVPADVVETQGLVISKPETYEWGWRTLSNNYTQFKTVVMVNAQIDSTGTMKGEANVNSFDYERLKRINLAKKGKESFLKVYGNTDNQTLNVEDVEFTNLESDSLPLVQKFKFSQNLNSSGDYKYFTGNLFTGLESNPFIADTRYSDVFFGAKRHYTLVGNYFLPEGYEFETLPKNIKMIMPDTSITVSRISQVNGSVLMTRYVVEFKESIYPASQYLEFQEFYQRLFEILNEQFVIRKKK